MSPYGLSKELSISVSLAKNFIDSYFSTYSKVQTFIDKTINQAEINGYILTQAGHKRTIVGINSENKMEKQAARRVAVNSSIQGTASDIMKRAMIVINSKIAELKLQSRLLLQIHDELLFEAPKHELEVLKNLVQEEMEKATQLQIPVSITIETGNCWGDFH